MIARADAARFYEELCRRTNGNGNVSRGVMPVWLIADHMGITEKRAVDFLLVCARYGITEKQGGCWVV